MSIESSYAKRHEITLPKDLLTARIDREAFEQLSNIEALTSLCIPWRLQEATLVLLLPEDCSENEWSNLASLARIQLEERAEIEGLAFRSSGLGMDRHREVLDFLYRRAESNISCVNMFEFVCPMRWNALEHTGDPTRRHCNQCQRDVHLVANEKEFENRAQRGDCVAYPPLTPTQELDRPLMLGRVLPHEELMRERRLRRSPTQPRYGAISFEDYLESLGPGDEVTDAGD